MNDEIDDPENQNVSLPDNAGVKVLPPFIYLVFFVASIFLNSLIGFNFLAWWAQLIIGTLTMSAGAFAVSSAITRFTHAGTNLKPTDPTTTLVTDGLYAYTRNPIYLGMTAFYVGACILFDMFWGLVLTVPLVYVINTYVIDLEETYLTRKFGSEYESYKKSVRRWL